MPLRKHIFSHFTFTEHSHPVITCSERQTYIKIKHCMYCRIHVEDPWSKSVSFLLQDTVELYLVFFLCYLVLVPLQVYAAMRQHHPVTRLFTASLILEFLALCLILLHVLKFSLDGSGFQQLAVAGDILDILSRVRNWSMRSSKLLLYICFYWRFVSQGDLEHVNLKCCF